MTIIEEDVQGTYIINAVVKLGFYIWHWNLKVENEEDDRICSVFDEGNCNFFFVYNKKKDRHIIVSNQKKCGPNIIAIAMGVVGAILGTINEKLKC